MSEPTTAKYGVQAAAFHEAIHIGRIDKAGTQFLDKEDATDMVLAAVAQYVRQNFGGGLTMDFTSKTDAPSMTLTITVTEHAASATAPELAERR